MLLTQTFDKLDALGWFGMALGRREQRESSQSLSLSFDECFGLRVDREAEARDSRRLALRLTAAKLRQEATVEALDFRAPRGLDRSVILHRVRVDPGRHPPRPYRAVPAHAAPAGRTGPEPWAWAVHPPFGAAGQDQRAGPG
jgi:hypothetical protein